MGERALQGSMDIRINVMIEVAKLLHLEDHAQVAAAFIASKLDLFVDTMPELRGQAGLSGAQLELAVGHSDVHTAVALYLRWKVQSRQLAEGEHKLVRIVCLRKMESTLAERNHEFDVAASLSAPHWEDRLTIAIAFAFQKNIVCQQGSVYASPHAQADSRRNACDPQLRQCQHTVQVSPMSLCAPQPSATTTTSWLVYLGAGRFPYIKMCVPLVDEVVGFLAWSSM